MKAFILIILLSNFSQAEKVEPINGEFGISLGAKLPEGKTFKKIGGFTKETKYKYEPKDKTIYKEIIVYVHPDTKMVYSIIAFKVFDNEQAAALFRKKSIERTERKYGKNITEGATIQGDKMVQVSYIKSRKTVLYGFTDIGIRKDAYIKLGMRKKD